ncbi:hypothetical protein GCM10010417_48560 [Streptomyces carpaticus]
MSWYADKARRLSRRVRSWASRLKLRFLARLKRRLLRVLTEPTVSEPDEEVPPTTPLRPRA